MKKIKPIHHKLLRNKVSAAELQFKTTNGIKTITKFIGQERAIDALTFGIKIESQGFNLYAMGPSGIGKHSLINSVISEYAKNRPVPPDWCYIHNFDSPETPIAIKLPAGLGLKFQQDMKKFVDEISHNMVTVFESNEYQSRIKRIKHFYDKKRKSVYNNKDKIDTAPQYYKEQYEKQKDFESKSTLAIIRPHINRLKMKYGKYKSIVTYLRSVQVDIVKNVNTLVKQDINTNLYTFSFDSPSLNHYKVNLLVNNKGLEGAPVIFEGNPTYSSLMCRIEHSSQMGLLMTNLTLIKSGSLHRANGGYLVIEARKLAKSRDAWEALKSALYSGELIIKPSEDESDSVKPISLKPEPIPLNVKVILMGDRNTYYLLCQNDPDFLELFKVAVDFDEQIDRNKKNIQLYARLIGSIAQRKNLHPFHATAVAEIIDHSSRLAEDIKKMSTHIRNIEDLIVESDYTSKLNNRRLVTADDVKQAILAKCHRMDRARDLYYEDIEREYIIINTTDKIIGQVNCLSVRRVGNFSYGHPTRVTARVRLGEGKIIDIQREIKLAGPLHSKASLIIGNYISSHFNINKPFSLSASLAFEQLYCWTDGDSASVGELCAIISAIAEVPINQSLAVTGSVDQHGRVQAIGGVNEKIEGFYDVCKSKGLTGTQGVLIPAVNVNNLMLREDIVYAAKNKQFFIYPIETIEEAVLMLTGHKPGERNAEGIFPHNTLYNKIEERLLQFTKNRIRNVKK